MDAALMLRKKFVIIYVETQHVKSHQRSASVDVHELSKRHVTPDSSWLGKIEPELYK